MRGRAFRASPEAMSVWHPFRSSAPLQTTGIPLGIDLQSGKLVLFHPFGLPTHSTTFMIEGEKFSGKSTFQKSLIMRCAGLQARDVYGEKTYWRTRINSRKSEQGVTEYSAVSNALYSPVYDLAKSAKINLFGLFQRESDIVEVAINLVQEVTKLKASAKVSLAIMVALRTIFANETLRAAVSPVILEIRLRQLVEADFKAYIDENHLRFIDTLPGTQKDKLQLVDQLGLATFDNKIDNSYIEAARVAADSFTKLLYGDYGEVFSGTESLYDVLSQRVLTLDWQNLNDNARTILESVLLKAESAAMSYGSSASPEGKDMTRIIPHLNISDEEGDAFKSVMHARFAAEKQNKSRAYPTADFKAVQYHTQVTQAGAEGSELRALAQEIDLGIGARVVFRQPSDEDFLQRFARLGMSDFNISLLPKLGIGEAMLWVRDYPPLRFKHILLESEVALVQTNAARKLMTENTPVWQQAKFRERAEKLGTIHVGLGDSSFG